MDYTKLSFAQKKQLNAERSIYIKKIMVLTENWTGEVWKKFRAEFGYNYNPFKPDLRLEEMIEFVERNSDFIEEDNF
jgi:hypothetical protein